MTAADIDLPAAFEALFGYPPREAPWSEAQEQRASQIAETWDDDTHTYRPLGPRKDRP